MKSYLKRRYIFLISCLLASYGFSQNNVTYNSIALNTNPEVVRVQISNETISLLIDEIDKSNPKNQSDNCDDCPDGKTLVLDIDFTRGFKFPITEDDSVYVRVTHLQKNLAENANNLSQVDRMNDSRNKSEETKMKNDAEQIKIKGQEIAKLMQEGKISPEEAQKQLLALTETYLEDINNSAIATTETQEFGEKANFAISFYNDDSNTEAEPFSGYLYIKMFDEKRFIAEFRGVDIEQCVEKRSASSEEEKERCISVQSQYLPDTKVLREGKSQLIINLDIKEFLNNR